MRLRALMLIVMAAGLGLFVGSAASRTAASANVGWRGFGNTPDEPRHSPLTEVTPANVTRLRRVFSVDFQQIDPSVRRGEQSYPVEANGRIYVTTNDDNVWALGATTGKMIWRWTPDNVAVFRNFGIVANRGVALCDGHVFVLTLDMTIAQLNPATGRLQRRVAIARAVPGAAANYGYSETSAPICAEHRLILGAAGSEYGARGFVMAYRTSDLGPAWPSPFWTIPPAGTSWRRFSTLAGGGVVWTPTTVDTTTDTLYFGTGSATPLYFPSIRPGSDPRSDSLIAVDLRTGHMKWWQQQMAFNEWAYDTAQPPLVYTAKVGGRKERIVSVATMEGVWFAYDAATGRPIYERVRVIDHTEHPTLRPGEPVAVFPSAIGGLNYSPASFDPHTGYVLNAAAETAAVDIQSRLTPTEKKRKFTLGDVFLGLMNGNFGAVLPGFHDHGSISAIDVGTGRSVWKFATPEPERGGVTTTESGLGFAGGGDGVLRAFDVKTGKVLWTFQTGHPIAAGASIYSVKGTEYIAITVGGTPTSSNGGTATQLQVFALGGSERQLSALRPAPAVRQLARSTTTAAPPAPPRRTARQGVGRIETEQGLVVQPWRADSSNLQSVTGRVLWNGAPVVGAHVVVDGYEVPRPTADDGGFRSDVDITSPMRHVVAVGALTHASVHGRPLTRGQQSALRAASGGFSVGYAIHGLSGHAQEDGSVVLTGRVTDSVGNAPPPVHLLTYQLSGTITDPSGEPVQGAVVVTRTQDRDFWTHSSPSDSDGHYESFFAASDETAADPVSISVGVAAGNISYGGAVGINVPFARLKSATMNIRLGSGASYTIAQPTSFVGAVYSGLVIGVNAGGRVIKPLAESWPSANGTFSMRLPATVRGRTLTLWQNLRQSFSHSQARAGGAVDLGSWPAQLGDAVPTGQARLTIRGAS